MAHAAPASRGVTGQLTRPRTPDVFSARTHRIAKVVVPVVLGLVYGYWAAAIQRYGGPITGWNLLLGFLSALVFAVLYGAVWHFGPRLRRELHAVLWFAFTGCATGFLISLSGYSVLWSMWLGLVAGAGAFVTMFYRYYTHEDATGHRLA
ncbi:integral membrane protein [Streptomyces viridochromogenes DSM 40736]|uniref:Integral membrane protein n=1 Tax=Streptomyces viridochromogenes (strain DSM 40736 / JCM 4977 / BCRC 1201 / Tue 494) TaxID=591159 RepID=D9X185_STRVT|nr:hypothetical protein [Streptomyces viridochromogenes]EFL33523.1 integral membrane protein [Streptomyces viridochromogenes DSM 40736]